MVNIPVSTVGRVIPAQGLSHGEFTASNAALPVAGAGVASDRITAQASSTASGVFMFDMHEGMGLELHFASREASGASETSTARIFREIALCDGINDNPRQWTYRHLCDVNLVASTNQDGKEDGAVDEEFAWCIPTVGNDAGLTPVGTRTMQGLTTGAAGSVIIDPVCASRIMVVCRKGTCQGVTVLASKWTGL